MRDKSKKISEKLKKNSKIIIFIILSISITALSSFVFIYAGDYMTWKSYDLLIKYAGGKEDKPHKDVMILLIDENSLRYGEQINLGRWPWARNIYPEILSFINQLNPPKGIFFDIFFFESDLGKGNDEAFSAEIANSGNVYQNIFLDKNQEREKPLPLPADVKKYFLTQVEGAENINYEKDKVNEFSAPIPCLRSSVDCAASNNDLASAEPIVEGFSVASFNPESDGIYRRGKILFSYGDAFLPSMSLAAVMAYTGEKKVKVLPGNILQVGKYKAPVDSEGKYLANYYGGENRITAYSMSALFLSASYLQSGEIEKMTLSPEDFKDKIVIIGCSAPGCQDRKNTPISETLPGPEIHATIISNILQQNHIIYEKKLVTFSLLAAIIFICAASILFIGLNSVKSMILVLLLSLYAVISIWLFKGYNYLSPILFILGAGIFSSAASFIYLSMTEGAEKRKYSKILGNMIDPHIVSEALKDLDALKQGGEKNITAFFSDIASFSTISEKLSSGDLAALLNEYLSAMTIILKKHYGTLDKYIGDAIVGIFGAPIDNPDSALNAARASLEMKEKLNELRKDWTARSAFCQEAQRMHARIGLNTGLAKVGFMGTENLASYTMMGDTVNLAARLESAGKDYGVEILVSEMTRSKIHHEMHLRLLDAVRVKGKTEPVHIYELIGKKGSVPRNIIESTKIYEDSFMFYKQKKWDEAIEGFKKSAQVKDELDKAAKLIIDRCLMYKKKPPHDEWDGVYTRTAK